MISFVVAWTITLLTTEDAFGEILNVYDDWVWLHSQTFMRGIHTDLYLEQPL